MAADEQQQQQEAELGPTRPSRSGRRNPRRRRLRNETLFVLSLIQGLCSAAALILCAVSFSTRGPVLTACSQAAAAVWVLCVAAHGVATSRHKTYCTLLTLFVLCQLACLAGAVLLAASSADLHAADAASDLVIGALGLLIGVLELGAALACCVACGRQLCRRDARIALDPGGRGLIVLEDIVEVADVVRRQQQQQQLPAPPVLLLPPPEYTPIDVVSATCGFVGEPPPAYAP